MQYPRLDNQELIYEGLVELPKIAFQMAYARRGTYVVYALNQ